MKKVLMVAGKMDRGGLEVMLMNFLRNIDSTKVHIDFLLHYAEKGAFDDEIRSLGSSIYVMPRLEPKNLFKYIFAVNKFFKAHKGEYDIVHGNITSAGIIYLAAAKLHGVKTCIIHAHYANVTGNHHEALERIMLKPLRHFADYFFACSDKAGAFCFGEKTVKSDRYTVIHNGVDVKKYSFDENKRNEKRKVLGLSDSFVLLHVGRFESEKNHKFLLDVFSDFLKTDEGKNARLLLAGKGSLEEEVKTYADEKQLSDKVFFLGLRDDVDELLLCADVFLLPSLFEGLPVVGVEAQSSGILCLFSDRVTKELDITGNCVFLPIEDREAWIRELAKAKGFERHKTDELIKSSGYELCSQAKWLENFYLTH